MITIMKKLVFAMMMCLTATMAQAQVLNKQTVSKAYDDAVMQNEREFAYNAEYDGDAITTLFVYKKVLGRRGAVTLTPTHQYQYAYDADGRLLSRTTLRWHKGQWLTTGRLDYAADLATYSVEYSRWNPRSQQFDRPAEKMTYTLIGDCVVDHVYCYQRLKGHDDYQLLWQTSVIGLPLADDNYLTQE